jgi:hypothetical protein
MGTGAWQSSLFAVADAPAFDPGFAEVVRRRLEPDAWLDHLPGWLGGADGLVDLVVRDLDWQQGTERIRGDDILRPRLTARLRSWEFAGELEILRRVGDALSERYGVVLDRVGVNLYRDGRDSVAWHGDRVARDRPTSTIAIVSLGQARAFRARPADGGASLGFALGHGDLLVMGGSFQRTWRHAVPKVAAAGPRISVTYRHADPGRSSPGEVIAKATKTSRGPNRWVTYPS